MDHIKRLLLGVMPTMIVIGWLCLITTNIFIGFIVTMLILTYLFGMIIQK